jgi:hypothetical protein
MGSESGTCVLSNRKKRGFPEGEAVRQLTMSGGRLIEGLISTVSETQVLVGAPPDGGRSAMFAQGGFQSLDDRHNGRAMRMHRRVEDVEVDGCL